ncbi:MAG: FkbM family methyltransferase [Verrucomicrobia bacterium]|nr:FkbM family methyltransferase [Verrucomicrobiota bacterium]MBS0646035.1 FkbM family methyltransferase [Verrucomicrobiota bacterium]
MKLKKIVANSFLFNLFSLARFSHARKYLIKAMLYRPDPYKTYVLSRNKQRSLCIWALKQIKHRHAHYEDDLYFWNLGQEQWLANLDHIHGLYEYLKGSFESLYACSCKNKTVLDIGGYIGDSARYFLRQGAHKVIIYEPVPKNVVCMQHNLKDYQSQIEIIAKAVADQDGEITIPSNYPPGHIGFGNTTGRYSLQVQTETFTSILQHTQVDLAKIDCEGYEKHLLDVPNDLLRKIPYWIIEIHHPSISEQLKQKFIQAGFTHKPVQVPHEHVGIDHFQLT